MLVSIDLDILNAEPFFRSLDQLLLLFENEQHEWYLEDGLDVISRSKWFENLSQSHKSILSLIAEKSLVRSSTISANEKRLRGIVKISNHKEREIPLFDALKFLNEPLLILVENIISDKLFIKRLFEVYSRPGKYLLRAFEKNFIDFYPSGGRNGMINTLKSLSLKKQSPYQPRFVVIVDSDKKYQNQPDDQDLVKLKEYCNSNNIILHVFYKRELENYIPEILLIKNCPPISQETLTAFCQMTAHQKDFYDLEKGFNGKPIPDNDPLFKEMSGRKNHQYNKLRYGFNDPKIFNVKQTMYKFVEDEDFNEKTIYGRCAHQPDPNELLNLLKLLENKL